MSLHQWRCVVDTNVTMTANGMNAGASASCVNECIRALQAVMTAGHLFIDDDERIKSEYSTYLRRVGEPGAGDAFFKWLLTHEWGATRVTRVSLTPKKNDLADFEELPAPSPPVQYDRSDRVFLAVAAAHRDHPPILQATDSKWWGWKAELAKIGVTIRFLCPKEIADKHALKMGT
jgi:hypothetical protein